MTLWQERDRARSTLAREVGYVRKAHGGRLRIALAFPNTYYVGMSNLGFQTVYRLFNDIPGVVCERTFLPPRSLLSALLASRTPIVTLESQVPVREFDVLAFSVSFEWDYPNVLTVLRLAGLPVYAAERSTQHPLVVIGGAVTFVNPEPLAPFTDVVAAGEGEELVPAIATALASASDRADLLTRLSTTRGFYVPSRYRVDYAPNGAIARVSCSDAAQVPVRKAAVKSTDALDPPASTIFTPNTEFGSRLLIEVVRGCANLCRFCWAGYNYLPVRAFPSARILERARQARPNADRVGLVSIALCDHPAIGEILRELSDMGYSISPASLRLDDLTPEIVRLLKDSGERTLTIAPEVGSDRLRRVINKTVTNDEILERTDLIFASGIENLKLYYMIGLPTETDEDLVAIRDLTLQMRALMVKHARARGRLGEIVGSVNPLIPKPGTAYQWMPLERPQVLDLKVRRLKALLAGIDNVHLSIKSERHAYYQALLSLGDRRIAPVVEAVERNGGNWRSAMSEVGLDTDFFVFRDRSTDPLLPWDVIDGGLKASFFRAEYEKGLRGEQTLPPRRFEEHRRLPLTLG